MCRQEAGILAYPLRELVVAGAVQPCPSWLRCCVRRRRRRRKVYSEEEQEEQEEESLFKADAVN